MSYPVRVRLCGGPADGQVVTVPSDQKDILIDTCDPPVAYWDPYEQLDPLVPVSRVRSLYSRLYHWNGKLTDFADFRSSS